MVPLLRLPAPEEEGAAAAEAHLRGEGSVVRAAVDALKELLRIPAACAQAGVRAAGGVQAGVQAARWPRAARRRQAAARAPPQPLAASARQRAARMRGALASLRRQLSGVSVEGRRRTAPQRARVRRGGRRGGGGLLRSSGRRRAATAPERGRRRRPSPPPPPPARRVPAQMTHPAQLTRTAQLTHPA